VNGAATSVLLGRRGRGRVKSATLSWFARQELRLAWREWQSLMTAGYRRRMSTVVIALAAFLALLHLPADAMVARFAGAAIAPDKATLIAITVSVFLYASLLLSQAMESVTRAFYARADLDLVLSAPVPPRRIFSVRIGAIALSMTVMAVFLSCPLIDVLAYHGGPRWLAAYGVVAAAGAAATAIAVALTVGLFRTLGPRRTRFVAQVLAAIIGAAFVIGMQSAAILYYGTFARPAMLLSDAVVARMPGIDSLFWLPARAITGDLGALAITVAAGFLSLLAAILIFSPRFGEHAVAAGSVAASTVRTRRRRRSFRGAAPKRALRWKELMLLRRDPWLASQTLMQLLYLLPPALLLSMNFGSAGALVVLVLVLVTVAGQLAGGLAWLAVSGEDAPDLVAAAPVSPRDILRAKVEAVMTGTAIVFVPLLLAFMVAAPVLATIAAAGIGLAAASSIRIQLWFRAQAKRSHFRRRHTSSRIATFAEAFSSFAWAGAAGLAASGSLLAAAPALFALLVLAGARAVSPRQALV
jgi:ABC-2 type transport system permease protein